MLPLHSSKLLQEPHQSSLCRERTSRILCDISVVPIAKWLCLLVEHITLNQTRVILDSSEIKGLSIVKEMYKTTVTLSRASDTLGTVRINDRYLYFI